MEVAQRAASAGDKAKDHGGVTSITIEGPNKTDASNAEGEPRRLFSKARIFVQTYGLDEREHAGFYEFTANQGSPNVHENFVPPSRSSTPNSSRPGSPPPHEDSTGKGEGK